ncbi:MAG: hypothetical protein WC285_02915 [Candidatus Gracilibacteria bacterium]|jgi:hypothetical protein
MALTYGGLLDQCEDLVEKSGCDTSDPYQRMFLESVNRAVVGIINDLHHQLYPDAPAGMRLPTSLKISEEVAVDILIAVQSMMRTETVSSTFLTMIGSEDLSVYVDLSALVERLGSHGEMLIAAVQDDVLPLVTEGSMLHGIVEAILCGKNAIDVLEDVIRSKNVQMVDTKRPEPVEDFVSGFRILLLTSVAECPPSVDQC